MTLLHHDVSLLIRAIDFAARKHRMQRRKDHEASPYINHPIALMSVLCVEADVTDTAILAAAALHDTIEDTETTLTELENEFGSQIAGIVAEMTDDKNLPKAVRKQLQIERASHKSKEATLVKLADKTCNLRDMASRPPETWDIVRRREYFEWAKAVVDGLPLIHPKLLELFEKSYAKKP
jgi:guanosine-3',5'-bis(diphosphate) 3'-pyrophosphohydrolase